MATNPCRVILTDRPLETHLLDFVSLKDKCYEVHGVMDGEVVLVGWLVFAKILQMDAVNFVCSIEFDTAVWKATLDCGILT